MLLVTINPNLTPFEFLFNLNFPIKHQHSYITKENTVDGFNLF